MADSEQRRGRSAGDASRPPQPAADRQRGWGLSDVHSMVDQQIREATARGEFDNLPGQGKPIEGLDGNHDPEWWLKKLVEREQIALLPPSLQLRRDDAALDELLDAQSTEAEARRVLEDFNDRVIAARYSTPAGPPLVTMPRDVDKDLESWRQRRRARSAPRPPAAVDVPDKKPAARRRWFRWGARRE